MKDRFKEISLEESKVKLNEVKSKLLDFRFTKVLGHVENPLEERSLRRQVARLNTIITEFEKGIRK